MLVWWLVLVLVGAGRQSDPARDPAACSRPLPAGTYMDHEAASLKTTRAASGSQRGNTSTQQRPKTMGRGGGTTKERDFDGGHDMTVQTVRDLPDEHYFQQLVRSRKMNQSLNQTS
jgi:hypothetical protein